MQRYTEVYKGKQGYTGVFTMVCKGMQELTRVYKGIQGVYRGIHTGGIQRYPEFTVIIRFLHNVLNPTSFPGSPILPS